jgi:hypothetical protein
MLMKFFPAHTVILCEREGIASIVNHDDRGRRKKTELTMIHEAEGLKKLTKKTHRRRLSDEAESDSIDSPIWACGTHMLMGFLHSHEVLPRS